MLKRHWKKILILISIMITISLLIFGILCWTGVLQFSDGVQFNIEIFDSLRGSAWTYVVFLILQVVLTILLSCVPATSMTFILLGVALFGATWQCFLISFTGVIISSILMDLVGRFGGAKLVKWLVGEEDYLKALDLVRTKKYTYLPFMYLLPMFPDDALCMVAGLTKIKFWYHSLIIVLCRGVGVATIVFGLNLLPYESFTTFYEWFVLGGVLIVYIFMLLKIANWIDKKLTKLMAKRDAKKETTKERRNKI